MWRRVILSGAGIWLAACAGPTAQTPNISGDEIAAEQARQQYFRVQTFAAQDARLQNVAFRIETANASECRGNVIPRLGFRALAQGDISEKTREVKTEALQLDAERPTVISVVENSPAARAGMQVGDVVIRVNGRKAPKEGWPYWLKQRLKDNDGTRPVTIEVRRARQSKVMPVTPKLACNVPVELIEDTTINAYTDSKRIVVYTAIMRVAQTDSELAAVVGHELAHVTMHHIAKQEQNRLAGAAAGFMADVAVAMIGVNTGGAFTKGGADAGMTAYAMQFEREADYVGAYYAVRAGYDLSSAERFWRAMAQESPQSIAYAGLHPTSPERFLQMQKTYAEIQEKVRLNQPLVPQARPVVATAQAQPADRD